MWGHLLERTEAYGRGQRRGRRTALGGILLSDAGPARLLLGWGCGRCWVRLGAGFFLKTVEKRWERSMVWAPL
jgi:hypothetical protein